VINDWGNVVMLYTYNPFGEVIESDGSFANPWRFTGQFYDSEIQQYYLRARDYNPHIYRFTARDPVFGQFEQPITLHKYLYCGNDQINYIDPDNNEFLSPDNMPEKINSYLAATTQKPLNDKGVMIRTILESLAFKYRWVIERIEDITDRSINRVHIVGGGAQNQLLCQFTANATGKKVIAGPVEATAAGNVLMQAKAAGRIESLAQARKIVKNSFDLNEYNPEDSSLWQQQYNKFCALLKF